MVENHSLRQFEKKWVEILELAAKRYEVVVLSLRVAAC